MLCPLGDLRRFRQNAIRYHVTHLVPLASEVGTSLDDWTESDSDFIARIECD